MEKRMTEWISVEDELPVPADVVPVVWHRIILYALYTEGKGFFYLLPSNAFQEAVSIGLPQNGQLISPTHWLRLQDPPNEI